MSEPLYPVPNFVDDPLTNPGSWQFVRKSDVSFDLDAGPGRDNSDRGITDMIVTLVVSDDLSDDQLVSFDLDADLWW